MSEDSKPMKVTDIASAASNVESAVAAFAERWIPAPKFDLGVEIMDQGQLRDALGLRATMDIGDPWPQAERLLLDAGFVWHYLSGHRVMYLRENGDYVEPTGWSDAEEIEERNT